MDLILLLLNRVLFFFFLNKFNFKKVRKSYVLHVWGLGNKGQLGNGKENYFTCIPETLEIPNDSLLYRCKIKQVSCGYYHTALLTENGEIFVTGGGDRGQLGLGNQLEATTFQKIPELIQVKKVSCGYFHTLALTETGEVFSWGSNSHWQLGHADSQDQFFPKLIQDLKVKIKDICCGSFHTLAITNLESIYSWGRGANGRLGHGNEQDQKSPKLIDNFLQPVQLVACGHGHTLALTKNGQVYSWGSGAKGKVNLLQFYFPHNSYFFIVVGIGNRKRFIYSIFNYFLTREEYYKNFLW